MITDGSSGSEAIGAIGASTGILPTFAGVIPLFILVDVDVDVDDDEPPNAPKSMAGNTIIRQM